MLKQSYSPDPPSEAVKELANVLVAQIVESGATFREANDALNLAWDRLESEAVPIIRPTRQQYA